MEFDKNLFMDYLKDVKNKKNDDYIYLYRLFNNYKITEKILSENSNSGYELLKKAEDLIYTVNGKQLSDKKRIEYELYKILENLEKDTSNYKKMSEILGLINEIKTLDLNQEEMVLYAKKKITLIQAKLGLKNTFFIASHQLFLEKYMNICMNNDYENIYINEKKKG